LDLILDTELNKYMPLILEYNGIKPKIHPSAFIAKTAVISGNVIIEEGASIWYGCVLRGDVAKITISKMANIQDNTVIHGTRPNHIHNKTGAEGGETFIGENVTVGHMAVIHAGNVGKNAFIGMRSIIMDLAIVEEGAMLAAGSLLAPKKIVKKNELWGGSPAKFMRIMTEDEINYTLISAVNYNKLANEYIISEQNHLKK
jgi:carbonic anhydrase/acetyltransferase-like protein (isoleucine patch superfamily)